MNYREGLIIAVIIITMCMTICKPEWLGNNEFLNQFITYEVFNLLGIILAITFASAENAQLNIGRIEKRYNSNFSKTRKEVLTNVYMLVIGLVFSLVLLLLKGAFPTHITLRSFVHAWHLVIIVAYIWILVDIHQLITSITYELTGNFNGEYESVDQSEDENEGEDLEVSSEETKGN